MMKSQLTVRCAIVALVMSAAANAQLDVGSDGSDGVFNPTTSVQIDLSLAASTCGAVPCTWDAPSPVAGQGVYDAQQWAVVFKFASVNIPVGVTITFKNHPSRAPVVWLVQGDVIIGGHVFLSGQNAINTGGRSEPGPGGFRGGRVRLGSLSLGSGGHGPGGGAKPGAGSYATAAGAGTAYGNESVVPLIGGSGGGAGTGFFGSSGGGAGGGAMLIAAGGTVTIDGLISANGGNGVTGGGQAEGSPGSGGAVRLIGNIVGGSGTISAVGGVGGGTGGFGRIRIETFQNSIPATNPTYVLREPSIPPVIFPPADVPILSITSVDFTDTSGMPQTVLIPTDPRASLDFPLADLAFNTDMPITLNIAATNVPLTWLILVRIVPKSGAPFAVTADPLMGTLANSTTTATFTLPTGFSAVQLRGAP